MRTFRFNTGVKAHMNKGVTGGFVDGNGVWVIPFDCEDVPQNATFMHAGQENDPAKDYPNWIQRKIYNSGLLSEYAYFRLAFVERNKISEDYFKEII